MTASVGPASGGSVFPPYDKLLLLYALCYLPNLSLSSLPSPLLGPWGSIPAVLYRVSPGFTTRVLASPPPHTLCILFQRLCQPAPCPSLLLSYLFLFCISFCKLPEKGRKFETLGGSVLWLVWVKVVNFP